MTTDDLAVLRSLMVSQSTAALGRHGRETLRVLLQRGDLQDAYGALVEIEGMIADHFRNGGGDAS